MPRPKSSSAKARPRTQKGPTVSRGLASSKKADESTKTLIVVLSTKKRSGSLPPVSSIQMSNSLSGRHDSLGSFPPASVAQPRLKILRTGHYAWVEAEDGSRDLVPVESLLPEYDNEISHTGSLLQTSPTQVNPPTTDTAPERSKSSIIRERKRKYDEEKEDRRSEKIAKLDAKHRQERLDRRVQRSNPKAGYDPRFSVPKDWSKEPPEVQEQHARRKVQRKASKKNKKANQRLEKHLVKQWRNEHLDQ